MLGITKAHKTAEGGEDPEAMGGNQWVGGNAPKSWASVSEACLVWTGITATLTISLWKLSHTYFLLAGSALQKL